MSDAKCGEGALELGAWITVIRHGIVTKEAEAVGINHQGQAVPEKETAKMLEVVPSGVGGDENRPQEFAGMVIDGEQEGLFLMVRPPLVNGGVVLPQFAEA